MNHDPPACVLVAEPTWGAVLHAAQSLGSRGIPVFVATLGRGADVFGRSRWVRSTEDFDPDSDQVANDLVAWLERAAVGEGPVPVLALSDRAAELLSSVRGRLPRKFRLVSPADETLDPLLTKSTSAALAIEAGLEVPPWVSVSAAGDIDSALRLEFPVVVRPESWSDPDEALKVERLDDAVLARSRLGELQAGGAQLVVSQFVRAPVESVEFGILWRSMDGSATAVCTGRKRRQAGPDGGVMAWGEAVDLPDVRQAALDFLDTSAFRGVGGIEFIRADGRLWFIEFNPRLEAIHFLASKAGLDTVQMAYRDAALDVRPEHIVAQRPATAWVGSAWAERLMSDPKEWRVALSDRMAFARSPGRVRSVLDRRDPMPALALAAHLGGRAWARLRDMGGRRRRR